MTEPFDLPGGEAEYWQDYHTDEDAHDGIGFFKINGKSHRPESNGQENLVKSETPYETLQRTGKPAPENKSKLGNFVIYSISFIMFILCSIAIYITFGLISGSLMIVW